MPANILPYPRNETLPSGFKETNLGGQYEAADVNPTASGGMNVPRSAQTVRVRLVKNGEASSAITPGLAVKYKAGYEGTVVQIAGLADKIRGFADEWLPAAGAAAGEGFYIIESGPCLMVSDGSSSLAQDDVVVSAAAGEVKKQVAAPADTTAAMVQVNSAGGFVDGTVAGTAHLAFAGHATCK